MLFLTITNATLWKVSLVRFPITLACYGGSGNRE